MSPHALMLKKASDGVLIEAAASDTGELKISGTIAAPEGGATEAAQTTGNASLSSIDGKLAALSGGRVPVVLAATPLPTDAATETTLAALSTKLPTKATIGSANVAVDASIIGVYMLGYDSNNSRWRRPYVDSSDRLAVATTPASATTTSRSAGAYEEQRGIDFSFGLWQAVVYSETTGYILLVNKGSDAINGDVPYGSNVYPIQAGQTIEIGALGAGTYENFTSGCQVVFSSTILTVTLGGAHCLITLKGA